ncbi:hypothetical protein ABFS83_02G155600 [Erythranthe nasuta]
MNFPRDKKQYVLGEAVGASENAVTYRGKHKNPVTGGEIPVGIKIFDTNQIEDIYFFHDEVNKAKTCCDHDNMVKIHCSFFADEEYFWIITEPLPGPTIRSTIKSTFRQGLPEGTVFFILKETLKALDYMHGKNMAHQKIGAGSVIFPRKEYSGGIKIVPRLLLYGSDGEELDFLPEWAAVKDSGKAGSKSADVWMFGLLAVELFYGEIPADDIVSSKNKKRDSIGKFIGKILGCFNVAAKRTKKMPEELREVVAACLSGEAERRPTASQLMGYRLFQKDFPNRATI